MTLHHSHNNTAGHTETGRQLLLFDDTQTSINNVVSSAATQVVKTLHNAQPNWSVQKQIIEIVDDSESVAEKQWQEHWQKFYALLGDEVSLKYNKRYIDILDEVCTLMGRAEYAKDSKVPFTTYENRPNKLKKKILDDFENIILKYVPEKDNFMSVYNALPPYLKKWNYKVHWLKSLLGKMVRFVERKEIEGTKGKRKFVSTLLPHIGHKHYNPTYAWKHPRRKEKDELPDEE